LGVFAPDGSAIAFMNLSERGAFGTLLGQVHIIPNHRGQPIQIREDRRTMPVTGGGHSIRADRSSAGAPSRRAVNPQAPPEALLCRRAEERDGESEAARIIET